MFKILVCGDRNWTDEALIRRKLIDASITHPGPYLVIHGNARGADKLGAHAAHQEGMNTHSFPAEWYRYGRGAGPIRNQVMLDQNPDIVIAFHDQISQSKGTKDMIERATKAGIVCYLVSHTKDGHMVEIWGTVDRELEEIEF